VFSDKETFSFTEADSQTLKNSYENIELFINRLERCLIENQYLEIRE
jgi:hypothetical protein